MQKHVTLTFFQIRLERIEKKNNENNFVAKNTNTKMCGQSFQARVETGTGVWISAHPPPPPSPPPPPPRIIKVAISSLGTYPLEYSPLLNTSVTYKCQDPTPPLPHTTTWRNFLLPRVLLVDRLEEGKPT